MKLNLLLSLGVVAVNAVVGNVIIPWEMEWEMEWEMVCEMDAVETIEQTSCSERRGYIIDDVLIDKEGECSYKYACFLPSGAKHIFPFAIKAQDPSECIEIEGQYYCSADINNIPCENCTFSQFVSTVYETFGERFEYEDIDVSKIKTPIKLPTDTTDEKVKCVKYNIYSDEEIICERNYGLYMRASFYPDCDHDYYACFLPNGEKVTDNGIEAQNLSECITIDGVKYCSIDFTNVSCPKGKECTFTEYVQEFRHVFGSYFYSTDGVTYYTEEQTDAVEDYPEYYTDAVTDSTEDYTEAVTDTMEDYIETVTDSI